jgi:DNA-binding CsgD family transcriptional regulator
MQMIAPRFNAALFADSLIDEESSLTQLLGIVIARAGYGLILANSDRQIIYANDAADALMRTSQGLCCNNDCVSATDFNSSRKLQSLILAATGQTGEPAEGGSMILRDENGAATIVVHVVPLARRPAEFLPCRRRYVAGLLIFDSQRGIADRVKNFADLFSLTSAETRILAQLLLGGGVTQAAVQLNIAQSTAQTHLKRILEKTGTHRQAELVKVFFEVTIPWCVRAPAKAGRFAPWHAAWIAGAAEDVRVSRRKQAIE